MCVSRAENFRWQFEDVPRDGTSAQELSELVGEGVAIVLEQIVSVRPVIIIQQEWRDEKYLVER